MCKLFVISQPLNYVAFQKRTVPDFAKTCMALVASNVLSTREIFMEWGGFSRGLMFGSTERAFSTNVQGPYLGTLWRS